MENNLAHIPLYVITQSAVMEHGYEIWTGSKIRSKSLDVFTFAKIKLGSDALVEGTFSKAYEIRFTLVGRVAARWTGPTYRVYKPCCNDWNRICINLPECWRAAWDTEQLLTRIENRARQEG